MMGKKEDPEIRFWRGVKKTDTCWLWARALTGEGYGNIWVNKKVVHSHRFSWELHNGPIPKGVLVLHRCDTPRCVRPDHLFLGSQMDNTHDCINKGRFRPYGHVMKKDRKSRSRRPL